MQDLRRLAWDLSLFTTQEFGFVKLPEKYCTGSSIMPNKRNPDTVELLRAVHAVVAGARVEQVAGLVTHELAIINAVGAQLTVDQRKALEAFDDVRIYGRALSGAEITAQGMPSRLPMWRSIWVPRIISGAASAIAASTSR